MDHFVGEWQNLDHIEVILLELASVFSLCISFWLKAHFDFLNP